ncbi:MAG: hypothetical protein IKO86_01590 [Prevotella sp.]|nr:hypothetical protein [Prevotella sp.]
MRKQIIHFSLFTFIFLLTACQFEDDQDCPKEEHFSSSYINLTIAVSNGQGRTRANEPLAGEDGNGREAGFERENAVTGVTLILYKDATGINTTTDPTLDLVRYFPVTKDGNSAAQGTTYDAGTGDGSHKTQIEATYTTGPQLLGKESALKINLSEEYHAIVVANHDLTSNLTEGVSKLSNVRDMTLSTIASGSMTDLAYTFGNFVMSSEEDNTIDFGATNTKKTLAGTAWTENDRGQDVLYDLTAKPLIIERMAARIDFWAKGATYLTKNGGGNGTTYAAPGYVYTPVNANGTPSYDRFVLTRITPFNLYTGDEYLLKHLSDGRLKPEDGTNYVIDPTTADKTTATYVSSLSDIVSGLATWNGNDYSHTIADMHDQVGTGKTGGFSYTSGGSTAEDIIICYPKENTLANGSQLYNYATGIMIEGDYYTNDDVNQREHRVYFTYIRHQGESDEAYQALLPSELSTSTTTTNPMNFGIVRNNIYRISIDKVHEKTDETPKITLKIKVKKWDKFEHAPIYM